MKYYSWKYYVAPWHFNAQACTAETSGRWDSADLAFAAALTSLRRDDSKAEFAVVHIFEMQKAYDHYGVEQGTLLFSRVVNTREFDLALIRDRVADWLAAARNATVTADYTQNVLWVRFARTPCIEDLYSDLKALRERWPEVQFGIQHHDLVWEQHA